MGILKPVRGKTLNLVPEGRKVDITLPDHVLLTNALLSDKLIACWAGEVKVFSIYRIGHYHRAPQKVRLYI